MKAHSSASPSQSGQHKRRLKNLLLDKKFQLKYTGYLVGIAFVLSATLGLILWRTSAELIAQGERSAEQGQQIVNLGEEVLDESLKVSAVVRMNIVNDPVYQEAPELLEAFNSDAAKQSAVLDEQRANLLKQRASLVTQATAIQRLHRWMLLSLSGLLTLLVLAIGVAGIFVTHKIAGPIFKMKKHLNQVAQGKLEVPWGLRKGDELVEFFDAFRQMVTSLRTGRESQIHRLQSIGEQLDSGSVEDARTSLEALKVELKESL